MNADLPPRVQDFKIGAARCASILKEVESLPLERHEESEVYDERGALRYGRTRWLKRGNATILNHEHSLPPINRVREIPALEPVFAKLEVSYRDLRRVARCFAHYLRPGEVIEPHTDISHYFDDIERWHVYLIPQDPKFVVLFDNQQVSWKLGDVKLFNPFCLHEYRNEADREFVIMVLDVRPSYKRLSRYTYPN